MPGCLGGVPVGALAPGALASGVARPRGLGWKAAGEEAPGVLVSGGARPTGFGWKAPRVEGRGVERNIEEMRGMGGSSEGAADGVAVRRCLDLMQPTCQAPVAPCGQVTSPDFKGLGEKRAGDSVGRVVTEVTSANRCHHTSGEPRAPRARGT